MKAFIDSCIEANKELKTYIDKSLDHDDLSYDGSIGFGGDKSLNIDLYAENLFIEKLSKYGNIYSEEIGFLDNGFKDRTIVIDPIDGSDNFYSGLDYYASSIALEIDGEVRASIVYNLVNGEFYSRYDDKFIFPKLLTKTQKIGVFERAYRAPEVCKELSSLKIKYRSPGAVALSLANARNYSFVLFWGEPRDFDIKAVLHINNDLHIYKDSKFLLVSKNLEIFDKLKIRLIYI